MRTDHIKCRYWLFVVAIFFNVCSCTYAQTTKPSSGEKAKTKLDIVSVTTGMLGKDSWKALQFIDSFGAKGYEVYLSNITLPDASGDSWNYDDLYLTTKTGCVTEIRAAISNRKSKKDFIKKVYSAVTKDGSKMKAPEKLRERFEGKEFWSVNISGDLKIVAVVTPPASKDEYWDVHLLLPSAFSEDDGKKQSKENKGGQVDKTKEVKKASLPSRIPAIAGIPILLGRETDCLLSFVKPLKQKIRDISVYSLTIEVLPQKVITWKELRYVDWGRGLIWQVDTPPMEGVGEDFEAAEKAFVTITGDTKGQLEKALGVWEFEGTVNVPHLKREARMLASWMFYKGRPSLNEIDFCIYLEKKDIRELVAAKQKKQAAEEKNKGATEKKDKK